MKPRKAREQLLELPHGWWWESQPDGTWAARREDHELIRVIDRAQYGLQIGVGSGLFCAPARVFVALAHANDLPILRDDDVGSSYDVARLLELRMQSESQCRRAQAEREQALRERDAAGRLTARLAADLEAANQKIADLEHKRRGQHRPIPKDRETSVESHSPEMTVGTPEGLPLWQEQSGQPLQTEQFLHETCGPDLVVEKSDAPATMRYKKDGSVMVEQDHGEDLMLERKRDDGQNGS